MQALVCCAALATMRHELAAPHAKPVALPLHGWTGHTPRCVKLCILPPPPPSSLSLSLSTIHSYIHTTYVCTYIHTYIHTFTSVHIYVYTYIHIYMYRKRVSARPPASHARPPNGTITGALLRRSPTQSFWCRGFRLKNSMDACNVRAVRYVYVCVCYTYICTCVCLCARSRVISMYNIYTYYTHTHTHRMDIIERIAVTMWRSRICCLFLVAACLVRRWVTLWETVPSVWAVNMKKCPHICIRISNSLSLSLSLSVSVCV
jgi:hypothetical protein